MAVDTVKLRSPSLTSEQADLIHAASVSRSAVDNRSGDQLYEITTASLAGSFDHRISVRLMNEEFRVGEDGVSRLEPSPPYLLIEGSVHKALDGHNVLAGPESFPDLMRWFLDDLSQRLGVELPEAQDWQVRQVDWAESFVLGPAAIREFMQGMARATFPRRKTRRYGLETLFFPGSTTTVKVYHKGPEFRKHDYKRISGCVPKRSEGETTEHYIERSAAHQRYVESVRSAADDRLRFEVSIHARKLDDDFGKVPLIDDIDDSYLISAYEREMARLMKEGESGMDTVRDSASVRRRLNAVYPTRQANTLMGYWMQFSALGEEIVKDEVSKATFYRVRRQLMDAGVSWYGGDIVQGAVVHILPRDFRPNRNDSRRCVIAAASVQREAA